MQFKTFLQIGIISADVKESVKQFERFGITPWIPMHMDTDKMGGMIIDGKPGHLKFEGALFKNEQYEIEIIQPVSESVFMDYLREHGPGVHHLAFKTAEEYDDFMEEFKGQGMKTIIEAMAPTGDRGFAYLDTLKELGFYAEIHKGKPGGADDFEGIE